MDGPTLALGQEEPCSYLCNNHDGIGINANIGSLDLWAFITGVGPRCSLARLIGFL